MIYLDTESCGLVGPVILIQYAYDDGPVILHNVWESSVKSTLHLIERICNNDVCGFNLTHDWFHLTKLFNLFESLSNRSECPCIKEVVDSHRHSYTRYCLRPKKALDLYLHARKGPWQSLMNRRDIKIKRIPIELAFQLAQVLKVKFPLPYIYFARGTEGYQWKVEPCEGDPHFANIVLRFKASAALKILSSEIFKTNFSDFPLPKYLYPQESSYNPYDTRWESVINEHIKFWTNSKKARSYAEQDVILLQRLYHHFGEPDFGDADSELACCIGASRWRGFEIDLVQVQNRSSNQYEILKKPKININSHIEVRRYLMSVATPEEQLCIPNTTAKTLEQLASFNSVLGVKAKEIYDARKSKKEIDILEKLKEVGRYCPNFNIIGTRSGRMSGGSEMGSAGGSINPQGIPRSKTYRSLFKLSNTCNTLSGGDFEGFEITIADAVYNDKNLRSDLQSGKSFHGLFGEALYDLPYDQIMASKGKDTDYYTPSKNSTFGIIYGALPPKIATVAGISEAEAESAYSLLIKRYPRIGISRKIIFDAFCSMRQPGGLGTSVEWHEPPEYISSLLGFKRYFTMENNIIRTLFKLAQNPPKELDFPGRVLRRDRKQTPRGAMQSALYGCAFQLQAYNMRAAANHVIQSTAAEITKHLQCRLWKHQPCSIHPWVSQSLNIHDEVLVVHPPEETKNIMDTVNEVVEEFRKIVPLIKMDWKTNLKNWSEVH